jgi:Fur family ferric uptake transcriptional regulator
LPHCQAYIQSLRKKGYRLTPQREMVIEVLTHSGQHMTAEAVFVQVQERTQAVNIATIYRTLDLLVSEGLVSKSDMGEDGTVYASVLHGAHLHLVCRRCGQVVEADSELTASLHAQVAQRYGFSADLSHLSLFGLCSDCWLAEQDQDAQAAK